MQRIIAALFFAFTFMPYLAAAEDNAVTKRNLKSLNLNVDERAILNEPLPSDICCNDHDFVLDSTRSYAEENLIEQMKIQPEFRYTKPEDYNSKLDLYDTEVKVNVKMPVDF